MSQKYTLSNPFFEYVFDGRPKHWVKIVVAWFVLSLALIGVFVYAYAVKMQQVFGFETTLLAGVAVILLTVMTND